MIVITADEIKLSFMFDVIQVTLLLFMFVVLPNSYHRVAVYNSDFILRQSSKAEPHMTVSCQSPCEEFLVFCHVETVHDNSLSPSKANKTTGSRTLSTFLFKCLKLLP